MKYGIIQLVMVLPVLAFVAACGSNNEQNSVGGGYYYPTCTDCIGANPSPTPITFTSGDTETLTPLPGMLNEYEGGTLDSPGPVQVNIALTPSSVGSTTNYLGTMQITYTDTGTGALHDGTFGNGSASTSYNGLTNNVSTQIATGVYRIFFEDQMGALVLIINATNSGTDTNPTGTGTIYFYNFNSTASNPLYNGQEDTQGDYFPPGYAYCWMITLGPYDCRNLNVPPTSAYSSSGTTVPGFQELGTISTINLNAALGI